MSSENKIPILSFFTGGGFLDMGFEMAGFEVVWSNEIDNSFSEMYSYAYSNWSKHFFNNNDEKVITYQKSIESIEPQEILIQAFGNNTPRNFGIIGGPPCQDFSAAGHNKGFTGERGKLTKIFLQYIIDMKPSFFVMENVKNLFNNNKHKRNLFKILKSIQEYYLIDYGVLNAIHYGVPQDRNRFFLIGLKKGESNINNVFNKLSFPFPKVNKEYISALTKYNWPTLDKFQNGVSAPSDIPKDLYVNDCLLNTDQEKEVPNGDEYFKPHSEKFWTIEEGNTKNRSFKRLHRYRFSPTACYGNNEVHLHAYLPRRISIREALRIQSVPDEYVLPKHIGLTQKFKMIGNGVPVKLAYVIADSLKQLICNGYLEQKET